jgi:hypothetical protein
MMFLRFGAVGYLHAADGYARNPQHQSKTDQCAAGKASIAQLSRAA